MQPKTMIRLGTGLVLIWVIVTFLVPLFNPWSRLNSWDESIDITCGRYRYERYLYFVKWKDSVEDTALSRLHRELFGSPVEPAWRRVNTFSPGTHHSPHYTHHGSLHAARNLIKAFELATFRRDAQREAVETFFRLLREDDDYFRAGEYSVALWGLAIDLAEDGRLDAEIVPADLPDPPPKQ